MSGSSAEPESVKKLRNRAASSAEGSRGAGDVVSGRAGEYGLDGVRRYEHTLPERAELTDRDAVARDDERLALVELAQDAPAFVAEVLLRDALGHGGLSVACVLRLWRLGGEPGTWLRSGGGWRHPRRERRQLPL